MRLEGGEMEMEEGEEETELVDGYSERGRGVLDNKWYSGTGGSGWRRRPRLTHILLF